MHIEYTTPAGHRRKACNYCYYNAGKLRVARWTALADGMLMCNNCRDHAIRAGVPAGRIEKGV